jgi:hypothetical protein
MIRMVESSEMDKSLTPVPITTILEIRDAAYQIIVKSSPLEAQL